jgi:hypothetical protein
MVRQMWGNKKKRWRSYEPTVADAPTNTQCDRFVALLLASGLVQFLELRDACAGFDTNRTDDNALQELCDRLVSRQLVTEWQCNKLRSGKWEGFYLDNYRLLSRSESSDSSSLEYLAEEVSTHERVTLVVTRLDDTPWIEYSVTPE